MCIWFMFHLPDLFLVLKSAGLVLERTDLRHGAAGHDYNFGSFWQLGAQKPRN